MDALNSLTGANSPSMNFHMPLRVQFVNEPGIDEGGVQKEFFMLLVKELIDPQYTMFNTPSQETQLIWFNGDSFESPIKYQLVGTLMGLAIFNGVLLDLPLPLAAYKKLLGHQPELSDLEELRP